MKTFPSTTDEIVAASKARAAARERAQYEYPGDAPAREVAQLMWSAFLKKPALIRLGSRRLAQMFPPEGKAPLSHPTVADIRDWILSRPIIPPRLWRPRRKRPNSGGKV